MRKVPDEWFEEHGEDRAQLDAEYEVQLREEYDRECRLLEQHLKEVNNGTRET
jgi:hypothetical protein